MEKISLTPSRDAALQATLPGLPLLPEETGRAMRPRPPVDRERARQACAPMGTLFTVVVTTDSRKRQRTWYVVDPDPALAHHYAAHGLELVEGCKVLLDAEAMRPIALVDMDPASTLSDADPPAPLGFNPYWDLPPT